MRRIQVVSTLSSLGLLGTLIRCAPDLVGLPGMIQDAQTWQQWLSMVSWQDYALGAFFLFCSVTLIWSVFLPETMPMSNILYVNTNEKHHPNKFLKGYVHKEIRDFPKIDFDIPIIYIDNDKSQKHAEQLCLDINKSDKWIAYKQRFKYSQPEALDGIKLSVCNINDIPKEAKFLAEVFRKSGICFDWWQESNQKDVVRIIIALHT